MSARRRFRVKPQRQRGISLIGGLLAFIAVAFVALVLLRVVPIYMDYFTIRQALEALKKEPRIGQMTPDDIYRAIGKRFDISYIDVVAPEQIKIRKQGNSRALLLVYEDRRPLFGNLDIVAKFNDTISLTP